MSNESEPQPVVEQNNESTEESSSDEEDRLFNLDDVSSDDRTFRSILSLLIGRQSVNQTLRLDNRDLSVLSFD